MTDNNTLNRKNLVKYLKRYRTTILTSPLFMAAGKSYLNGVSDALTDVLREIEAGDFDQ